MAYAKTNLGNFQLSQVKTLRVLPNLGCSATIIKREFIFKLRVKQDATMVWNTENKNLQQIKDARCSSPGKLLTTTIKHKRTSNSNTIPQV